MKFYARKTWGNFAVDIFGYIPASRDRRAAIAQPVLLKSVDQGMELAETTPMMSLHPEEAQQLVDALWDVGLRPSEGTGSAGSLAATQKHLEDMRSLVKFYTAPTVFVAQK